VEEKIYPWEGQIDVAGSEPPLVFEYARKYTYVPWYRPCDNNNPPIIIILTLRTTSLSVVDLNRNEKWRAHFFSSGSRRCQRGRFGRVFINRRFYVKIDDTIKIIRPCLHHNRNHFSNIFPYRSPTTIIYVNVFFRRRINVKNKPRNVSRSEIAHFNYGIERYEFRLNVNYIRKRVIVNGKYR